MHIQHTLNRPARRLLDMYPALRLWLRLPALTAWIALSVGIVAGPHLPGQRLFLLYPAVGIAATLLLSASALLTRSQRYRIVTFAVIGVVLSQASLARQRRVFQTWRDELGAASRVYLRGQVISSPLPQHDSYRFLVQADSLYDDHGRCALRNRILDCRCPQAPALGEQILLVGMYRPPAPRKVSGAFDQYTFMLSNDIWGTFRAWGTLELPATAGLVHRMSRGARRVVYATLAHANDAGRRALLQAAFLGEKTGIPAHLRKLFRDAGLAHLLAISGLHVGIITSVLLIALALVPAPPKVRVSIVVAALWCYVLVVGTVPSLLRAVMMATVVAASLLFQRRSHTLNALGVAGVIWLYFSPTSIAGPSYQLSFAATAGILTLYPLLRTSVAFPATPLGALLTRLWHVFSVSLAAFATTLPIMIHHFGTVSLFGLAANLVAVLLMTICMWFFFGALIKFFVLKPLVPLCMWFSELFLGMLVWLAGLVEAVPWSVLALPPMPPAVIAVYGIGLLAIAAAPRKRAKNYTAVVVSLWAVVLPLWLLARDLDKCTRVAVIPTRDSVCIAIRAPSGKAWVCGSPSQIAETGFVDHDLGPWMRNAGVRSIEAVILLSPGHLSPQQIKTVRSALDRGPQADREAIPHPKAQQVAGPRVVAAVTGVRIAAEPQCTCVVTGPITGNNRRLVLSYRDAKCRISPTGYVAYLEDPGGSVREARVHPYGEALELRLSPQGKVCTTLPYPRWHPLRPPG